MGFVNWFRKKIRKERVIDLILGVTLLLQSLNQIIDRTRIERLESESRPKTIEYSEEGKEHRIKLQKKLDTLKKIKTNSEQYYILLLEFKKSTEIKFGEEIISPNSLKKSRRLLEEIKLITANMGGLVQDAQKEDIELDPLIYKLVSEANNNTLYIQTLIARSEELSKT